LIFRLATLEPSLKFSSFVLENLPSTAELLEFDSLLLVSDEKPPALLLDDTQLRLPVPVFSGATEANQASLESKLLGSVPSPE